VIVAVDLAQLADAAFNEAQRHPPRSPARRAASHLWISLTLPPAKSIASARSAIASFGSETTQAGALELLHRLAKVVSEAKDFPGEAA
jgi:hypothetical protein